MAWRDGGCHRTSGAQTIGAPAPRMGSIHRICRSLSCPVSTLCEVMKQIPAVRSIPFFNYTEAFAAHEEAFVDLLRDIIRRGAFIQQRDLAEFEENLAEFLGVRYAIGVGNATDGLGMSLR